MEEHLDEAEFGVERFEDALESPILTLKELAAGVESRLFAHVDGLQVGGATVVDRILAPVLNAPEAVEPSRLTAAAIAVVEGGRFELLQTALASEDAAVRGAVVRACGLGDHPGLDAWLQNRLGSDIGIEERAALLAIAAGRGLASASALVEWLQGESVEAAKAASEAARLADPRRHLPVIEWLLGHPDEGVREAALVTAWMWRSPYAFRVCERWALGSPRPRILPMALYASLGAPAHAARLAEQLRRPSYRNATLFALGFSGHSTQLSIIAQYLESDDPLTAKFAAQAISMITGLDLSAEGFALSTAPAREKRADHAIPEEDPEAALALPPLDEDDLEADLVPAPESSLPIPNPVAIRRFCEEAMKTLSPDGRYLGGRPLGPRTIVEYLAPRPCDAGTSSPSPSPFEPEVGRG